MMKTRVSAADDGIRRLYAVELLKHRDPWQAALATFPGDIDAAIEASRFYPNDPVVVAHMKTVREAKAGGDVLPTKDDLARELWKTARVEGVKIPEKLAALRLYAEVMEYTAKSSSGATVQVNATTPHVLMVPQYGTPEEWEEKTKYQQRKLIEQAHGVVSAASH